MGSILPLHRWETVRGTVPRWNCASIPDAAGPVAPVARSGESHATSQFGPDGTGMLQPQPILPALSLTNSSPDDSFAHPPPTTPASTGRRHLRACKRQLALRKSSMPQTAESVGGSRGRQRYVHRKSGKLRIPRRPARANGRRQQYQDGILLCHVHAQGGSIIV